MTSDGWLEPTTFEAKFRQFQKRLDRIERGGTFGGGSIDFSGLAGRAIRLDDWNSPDATINGFYYSDVDAQNTPLSDTEDPPPSVQWIGYTISIDDNNGLQQVWEGQPSDEDEPEPPPPDPPNPEPTEENPEPAPPVVGATTSVRQFIRYYSTNENNFTAYTEWEPSGGSAGGSLGDLSDVKLFDPIRNNDMLIWNEDFNDGEGAWSNVSFTPGLGVINQSLQTLYDIADELAENAITAGYVDTVVAAAANGKNKVTYSNSPPGTAANTAGDIWWVRDGTPAGNIVAQYEGLGGTSWASRALRNEVIANLDAGKITANSTFTNNLTVATNFTLGTAGTNGVIQSFNFAGSTVGVVISKDGLTAKGGTVTGASIVGGTVEGATIRTAGSGQRIVISGATNLIQAYSGQGGEVSPATIQAYTAPSGHPGMTMSSGTSSGAGTRSFIDLDSGNSSTLATATIRSGNINLETAIAGKVTLVKLEANGLIEANVGVRASGVTIPTPTITAIAANVSFDSGGNILKSSSSRRFKSDIKPMDLDPETVMALEPKTFNSLVDETDARLPGFIAEEADDLGLDAWVTRDAEGVVEGFAYAAWPVAQQVVLRNMWKRMAELEQTVATLRASSK